MSGAPLYWRDLAARLALAGDEAGAQDARAKHASLPLVEPRLVQAAAMLRADQTAGALALLQLHLSEHTDDVAALNLLAEAQARDNRPDEAEATLRRCIALAPAHRRARLALAQLLRGQFRLEDALIEVRSLIALDPNALSALHMLGSIYLAKSDYDRAVQTYEALTKAAPERAGAWLALGHALKIVNRTEEGIGAYRRAIELGPHLGEAYLSLGNLKTVRFGETDVAQMRNQVARADGSIPDRVNFLFALGKAAEDAGDIDTAFKDYSEGAALHLSVSNYVPGRFAEIMEKNRAVFTRDFFAARKRSGAPAQDPIFIVGLPRSGSTLLEQILASHSMVEGTAELPDMHLVAQSLVTPAEARAGKSFLDVVGELDPARLRELGDMYLRTTKMHRVLGRRLFINKMPNDFLHIGLIQLTLPNAKIIDARRHPMACGWSCFKQHFPRGQLFTYDLSELGRYYAGYVGLMGHYDRVLPGRVHRVIHEELAADPETHIRALLDHCGLPFEAPCLSPHDNPRAVKTASSEQVRQPISVAGLDSWRRFESHIGALRDALGPVLEAYPAAPS